MRQSKLKASELEAQELAENNRVQGREDGYSMMYIRDRGWQRLTNGSVIQWHVDKELEEAQVRTHVPEGIFLLDGKPYDVDEFRKYLRWA